MPGSMKDGKVLQDFQAIEAAEYRMQDGTKLLGSQGAAVADAAAATAIAVETTGATNTSPYGFTTAAQADALVTGHNALLADVASLRTQLNTLLARERAHGIIAT